MLITHSHFTLLTQNLPLSRRVSNNMPSTITSATSDPLTVGQPTMHNITRFLTTQPKPQQATMYCSLDHTNGSLHPVWTVAINEPGSTDPGREGDPATSVLSGVTEILSNEQNRQDLARLMLNVFDKTTEGKSTEQRKKMSKVEVSAIFTHWGES